MTFGWLHAQSPSEAGEQAKVWSDQAKAFRQQARYDSAAWYYGKAVEIHRQQKQWKAYVSNLSLQGSYTVRIGQTGTIESGIRLMEQAIKDGEKHLPAEDPEIAKAYSRLGAYHLRADDYFPARNNLETSLSLKMVYPDSFSVSSLAGSYANLGTCLHRLGFLDQAQQMLEKGLNLLEENDRANHLTASVAHSMLAMVLMDNRDYQSSIDHMHKSLGIKLAQKTVDSLVLAQTYMNLGLAHFYKNEWDQAQHYYQEVVRIQQSQLGPNHPALANTYLNVGAFYQKQGRDSLALAYYREVQTLFQNQEQKSSRLLANSFLNQGLIHQQRRNLDQALVMLRLAMAQLVQNDPRHPELAKCLMIIANIHQDQGLYDLAEIHYQKALAVLHPTEGPLEFSRIYPLPLLLEIYSYQVANFLKSYRAKNDIDHLQLAFEKSQIATQLIDSIRLGFEAADSKEILAHKTKGYYGDAIEVCWELYQQTQDPAYVWQGFLLSEKSKALLLHEALNESQAQQFANIPQEILEEVEQLKQEISYFQKQIFDARSANGLSAKIAQMEAEVVDLKQQYAQKIRFLEKKYPDYYNLKYHPSPILLEDLQDRLRSKQDLLVSYFFGNLSMYIFLFKEDQLEFFRSDSPIALRPLLSDFCRGLYDPQRVSQGARSPYFFRQFHERAYYLYQELLAPVMDDQDTASWIIIPDGELGYLPFELLLTDQIPDTMPVDYSELPYVLKKHRIRYEYSTSLYLETYPRNKDRRGYAGFAPASDSEDASTIQINESSFQQLIYSREEVEEISDLMGGKAFLGEEASKENLIRLARKYQILHLAMHAYTHDEEPLYSGMIFNEEEDILYAHELYNLRINADLVVLSACNTGQGKLARGEGILSLARAFKYAGCPNIVMSLWQVDDKATKNIMRGFFEGIQNGLSKDEALREAKLSYLASSGNNLPYYWAAFVLIGDPSPVDIAHFPWGWGLMILGLLFGGIALYRARRRKS